MIQEVNTIYFGDCLQLIKQLDDNSVDVCFTSPPYNRIRNDTYALYDDTLNDYYGMLVNITDEMLRVARKDVIINIQMILFNKEELCRFIGNYSKVIKGIVIWEKSNPQPATNFKNDTFSVTNAYEFFFVLSANGDLEFRANNKIKNIITTNVNSEHFDGHGAVMRLDVAEHFIRNFTKEDDLILDPFMGMGTTGVACVKNKRNFIGFEIVEEYKERALQRINNFKNQMNMFDVMG